MKKLFKWIKWYCYDIFVCDHVEGQGILVDIGRNKCWWCTKCGILIKTCNGPFILWKLTNLWKRKQARKR